MANTLSLFSIGGRFQVWVDSPALLIVAADGASNATKLVQDWLQRECVDLDNFQIDYCKPVGTTTLYNAPRIVDNLSPWVGRFLCGGGEQP